MTLVRRILLLAAISVSGVALLAPLAARSAVPAPVALPGFTPGTGAADLNLSVNLSGATQFGDNFSLAELSQDGYATGRLTGIEITQEGVVQAFTARNAPPGATGVLIELNQKKLPGCYYHRSNPNDVARVEKLTEDGWLTSRPSCPAGDDVDQF